MSNIFTDFSIIFVFSVEILQKLRHNIINKKTEGGVLAVFTCQAELELLINILRNFHINTVFLTADTQAQPKADLGLRDFLGMKSDYESLFSLKNVESNTVYKITDTFYCCYIFIVLPDRPKKTALVIGPFTNIEITKQMLLQAAEDYDITPEIFSQIEKYYTNIPILTNESTLFAILNAFGEKLWGSLENFSIKSAKQTASKAEIEKNFKRLNTQKSEDANLSIQTLEMRYAKENDLLDAVAKGMVNKAELMLSDTSRKRPEQRIADPVRSLKNYTIILNTLLRKAAEKGGVHPLHIDTLSSDFAKRIELINSVESGAALQKEMAKSYATLVRDHSVKQYTHPVRQIILNIEYDLTADLTLKKFARMLSLNPSYLSALFKKETGMTLTDFVTRKRMEHAADLLNSTSLQIQTVAQQCGILDVNYFTKTFRKIHGKTPSEYRIQQ